MSRKEQEKAAALVRQSLETAAQIWNRNQKARILDVWPRPHPTPPAAVLAA